MDVVKSFFMGVLQPDHCCCPPLGWYPKISFIKRLAYCLLFNRLRQLHMYGVKGLINVADTLSHTNPKVWIEIWRLFYFIWRVLLNQFAELICVFFKSFVAFSRVLSALTSSDQLWTVEIRVTVCLFGCVLSIIASYGCTHWQARLLLTDHDFDSS